MRLTASKAWLSLVCLLASAGCGYRFTTGHALAGGARAAYVPVFVNRTAEPTLEVVFTQALREQLAHEGLAAQDAMASVRLEGELVAVSPPAPNPAGGSYSLNATAVLRLTKEGRLVASTVVGGTEEYLAGADILLTEANRGAALRRMAAAMMKDGLVALGDWN